METTSATTTSASAGLTSNTAVETSKTELSSDFDTFLRMLTVQVQNQDPMNPVDSTDYATQLATFSSVEQQIKTNELLSELAGKSSGAALQQYGSWIGMEALVDAPVHFEGTPVAIRPEINAEADKAALVVIGPGGEEVERFDLPADQDLVLWSGRDETGATYPSGNYRFEVESYRKDEVLGTQSAPVYSRVDEIRAEGSSVMLRLSDGSERPVSLVNGLRNPAG